MIWTNSYARWRVQRGSPSAIHDGNAAPAENLLQLIWQHQRLHRDSLKTTDGQRLRVLHPGFRNREAGPDFHGAVVQFDGQLPTSGDVEIDLQTTGWRAHGHDHNERFRGVMLHVVWQASAQENAGLPTLPLADVLDAPLRELNETLAGQSAATLGESFRGRCNVPLRGLPAEALADLLEQAGLARLNAKADWIATRARLGGWEQALWEASFRVLGYKQNIWPFLRLAEVRPALTTGKLSPLEWQARLLGTGGLLPADLTRRGTDDYLRRIWDLWWRERDAFSELVLPRSVWKFNGLRPANHPTRRLALAAHWLASGDLPVRLEKWFASEIKVGNLEGSLLRILEARDAFWTRHWSLRSAATSRPQPLLGAERVTDLAVNAVLPWLLARGKAGENVTALQHIEERYKRWPAAQDNALLKLARQRLCGGERRGIFKTAAQQQGLLQIVHDFCSHSNALCEQCCFPELIREWVSRSKSSAGK